MEGSGSVNSSAGKDDTDGGLKLALIEEMEAHLHPQAQLRLSDYEAASLKSCPVKF